MQTATRLIASAFVLLAVIFSAAPARARTTPAPAVGQFYATTRAVYDAWQGSPAPAQHPSLPAGTTQVGLYFVYSGAKAGVTTYRIAIYTAPKGTAVFVGERRTLTHSSNGRMSLVPFDKPLARGLYRADVTLGNGFTASGNLKSSLFFAGHLFTPTSPNAGYKGSRSISYDSALDNEQYQAVLLVNGVPEASTAITVGP